MGKQKESLNNINSYKDCKKRGNMEIYKDLAGTLFSGLALMGTSSYIPLGMINNVLMGYALILILFTLFWRFAVNKKIDIYLLALFGAIYAFFSVTNFLEPTPLGLMSGLFYLTFSIISVKQAMVVIANEEN